MIPVSGRIATRGSAALVLNPHSGTLAGDDPATVGNTLRTELQARGVPLVHVASLADGASAAFDAALETRPDVLWVAGGDGTVSAAAGRLAGTPTALAVLPLGTLNHFARDLGVPADWREAVHALAAGRIATVDVGTVNDRVFVNNCSLGIYADAVRRRDRLQQQKGWRKTLAMACGALSAFADLRRMRLTVDEASDTRSLHTPFVLIGNNRYTGPALATSLRPRLDEGQLWFCTTRAQRHRTLLRIAWATLVRRLDSIDALEVFGFSALRVGTERGRVPIAADGELLDLNPPFHFAVRPRALRVIRPAPASA